MPAQAQSRFRFNAKKVALTYSCPDNLDAHPFDAQWNSEKPEESALLTDFFNALPEITKYLIGKENHENGKSHYHMFLEFKSKLDTRNQRRFDWLGVHPNIISNPSSGWHAYCAKEGEFVTNFYKSDPWKQVLECDSLGQAEEILWQSVPKEMCKHATQIRANLCLYLDSRKKPKYLRNWKTFRKQRLDSELLKTKCVIACGEPGIGKSQWARRHFDTPLVVTHNDDFKKYRAGFHDGIVVDDVCFNHHPVASQIHIVDVIEERSIHCRNTCGTLSPGPMIITCNPQRFPPVELDDGAVARRCEVIQLGSELLYCTPKWTHLPALCIREVAIWTPAAAFAFGRECIDKYNIWDLVRNCRIQGPQDLVEDHTDALAEDLWAAGPADGGFGQVQDEDGNWIWVISDDDE